MNRLERLGYSSGFTIAFDAVTALPMMIAAADGVDLLPKATIDFVFPRWHGIAAYALAFLLAPIVRNYLHDRDDGYGSVRGSTTRDRRLPFARFLTADSSSWSKGRLFVAIRVVALAVAHLVQVSRFKWPRVLSTVSLSDA